MDVGDAEPSSPSEVAPDAPISPVLTPAVPPPSSTAQSSMNVRSSSSAQRLSWGDFVSLSPLGLEILENQLLHYEDSTPVEPGECEFSKGEYRQALLSLTELRRGSLQAVTDPEECRIISCTLGVVQSHLAAGSDSDSESDSAASLV